MKKIFILSLLSLTAIFSAAQEKYTTFGLKAAIGGSTFRGMDKYSQMGKIPGSDISTTPGFSSGILPSWDFGIVVQHMNNGLLIQGEFITSNQGIKLKNADIKEISGLFCTINIDFGTKIIINDRLRGIVGLGPYVSFNFMKWISGYDNYISTYDSILEISDANYRSADFGGSVIAGLEYENMQFTVNYYHGLYNIVFDEHSLYNRICKLSFVYFF